MRVKKSVSKNSINYAIIKDILVEGKRSTTIVENLGNHEKLLKEHPEMDPMTWAKQRALELTELEKNEHQDILLALNPKKRLKLNQQREFLGGYLFLQKIYYELGLHKIAKEIQSKYKITFPLNDILSRLVYGRILSPSSKKSTVEFSKYLLEEKEFDLQHFYRSLEVIAKESDFIQSNLYQNSLKALDRQKGILYYDCTNFYFEIEEEDSEGIRKYGCSKENRPNPIVEMGLFMDASGIPLAFCIHPGNTNEQTTMKPLEKKIINDFKHSKFIVCTDAGLSSKANKRYNTIAQRGYVTTQSIKKLSKEDKEWALSDSQWSMVGSNDHTQYSISEIEKSDDPTLKQQTFYKVCEFPEKDIPHQRLIVTFSLKYRDYQRGIRERHIQRALHKLESPSEFDKKRSTDFKRLVKEKNVTDDGEVAERKHYSLDEEKIAAEMLYDGIYAVSTNLDDDIENIIRVGQRRWEIEESFRIMKSEFKSRPVYLSRKDRIEAHFMTCFLALTLYRVLEHKLEHQFTCPQILKTLREFNFNHHYGIGYVPTYSRNEISDKLRDIFQIETDFEIISEKNMKNIFKFTKQ